MLSHILRRCAQQLGYQDLSSNPQHRQALLDIINEAALRIYEETDHHGALGETTVVINPAIREIALPPFVGELRAVREARENLGSSSAFGGDGQKWSLLDVRPRYQISEWTDLHNNFRLKGYSPVAVNLGTGSKIGILCKASEPTPVQITVTGSTVAANMVSEVVESNNCDDPVYTQNVFTSLRSVTKTTRSQGDILLLNLQEEEIGVLYNDHLESRYLIVEVSQYPFTQAFSATQRLVDVLFKKPFVPFRNDNDEFPIFGFDDIIFQKVLALKAELQPGAEKRALLLDAKVSQQMHQKGRDRTGHIKRKMTFGRPPMYDFEIRTTPTRLPTDRYIS